MYHKYYSKGIVKCSKNVLGLMLHTKKFHANVKFVGFSKDCDQDGDKMSKINEKLPYLH